MGPVAGGGRLWGMGRGEELVDVVGVEAEAAAWCADAFEAAFACPFGDGSGFDSEHLGDLLGCHEGPIYVTHTGHFTGWCRFPSTGSRFPMYFGSLRWLVTCAGEGGCGSGFTSRCDLRRRLQRRGFDLDLPADPGSAGGRHGGKATG